ncbi:MAG: prepilin-type N-terminal cleavage/methylation domain-containing protein [Rubrivivax sp.]|nr:prepilin-type N-terminal cleavage/methylation domain-containing protein [Rubrivivax sp.]
MTKLLGTAPSGVTLLELVATLAVLAVLCSLALPSLGQRVDRARLAGAAELLAADIADARFEAARLGRPLHVQARPGADWCWSVANAPGCGCAAAQACQLKTVQAPDHPGVRLLEPFSLQLHPGGEADTQPARLEGRRGERLRVALTPLGRTRICSESAGERSVAGRYPPC